MRLLLLTLSLVLLLAGCTGAEPGPADERTGASSTGATPSPSDGADASAAPAPPAPRELACRNLSYDAALAPTDDSATVSCGRRHTAQTFAVGRLRTTARGHLLAVDSAAVQAQVARECPARLRGFLGATVQAMRLSAVRAVWFTPTVEESDLGADWFRCDAIVVAGPNRLAPVRGSLQGALRGPAGRSPYSLCANVEPGRPRFRHVVCRDPHRWRAVATVALPRGAYPGAAAARAAGQARCEAVGRAAAGDPLDFQWGYEWPTRQQWNAGQTFGRCWVPDRRR